MFFAAICWGSSDTKKLNKLIRKAGSVLFTGTIAPPWTSTVTFGNCSLLVPKIWCGMSCSCWSWWIEKHVMMTKNTDVTFFLTNNCLHNFSSTNVLYMQHTIDQYRSPKIYNHMIENPLYTVRQFNQPSACYLAPYVYAKTTVYDCEQDNYKNG